MARLAAVQPLILVFEDIHWAEAPLLDLIEYLADSVRAPVLILCLARPELLDARVGWGGGRVRSTAIELEPLSEDESELLIENLVEQLAGSSAGEGEPPDFSAKSSIELKATHSSSRVIRMLVESGAGDARRIACRTRCRPHRRTHRPPVAVGQDAPPARCRHRARVLTVLEHCLGHLRIDVLLDDLRSGSSSCASRDPRSRVRLRTGSSTSSSARSCGGMAKLSRAQYHARVRRVARGAAGEELVEIRAYHLDRRSGS
jgi:hypothetical protein